ncbi:MAG TPA: phosphoribosylformylglycinamidine synthase subunit PurL [Firmicutes bacterium]|nr:phosphoribosylformylglycinamidine synthase subunit PurL [Bacillota bacterium]
MKAENWQQLGLKPFEYEKIVKSLGREPTWTELGMFSVLWSEHCAYKHSRKLLKTLPTQGERVLIGPGENAGVVDLGDGLAVVMKIESHNHPIAVEPYQGAATGVGGIVRDIMAMGARPVALLDSLRFGPLEEARNRFIFGGTVGGIAGYGNCLGIPTVGGEVYFEEAYSLNPLCNVLCVGVIEKDKVKRGRAAGEGNAVILIGNTTGRDGIHGCTFASEELGEDTEEKRPNIQVGDPFTEKLLIEACLELVDSGAVVGMTDMGAAGITSSCAEAAARAGMGIEIDVAKVPLREEGMTPYEIMLSESQERMLIIAEKGKEDQVKAICDKWGLRSAQIGVVTADGMFRVRERGTIVAEVPAKLLAEEAPIYTPEARKPAYLDEVGHLDPGEVSPIGDAAECLRILLRTPDLASKEYVYRQYDHMVRTDTIVLPGADAAVLRVKGSRKGFAVCTDGNGRHCYLDPRSGAISAVAEAARNVCCVGAKPVAVTNCLNFGNPEKPEVFWQFSQVIEGMAEACLKLGTPVIGGNVSFYNETSGHAVYPTPVIGMLGIIQDTSAVCTPEFKLEGDIILLLGPIAPPQEGAWLGGSEYLRAVHRMVKGKPARVDLELEKRLQAMLLEAIGKGLLKSAHDISDGGLAVALAECCFGSPAHEMIGASVVLATPGVRRRDELLFGEAPARVIVSADPSDFGRLKALAEKHDVPLTLLGKVGGDHLDIAIAEGETKTLIHERVEELRSLWQGAIECLLK